MNNCKKSSNFQSSYQHDLFHYGYYCNNALHFYGFKTSEEYNDSLVVSKIINESYGKLLNKNISCIGQDIFGNQFVKCDEKYYFLNIETADMEFMSDDYDVLINKINDEVDYYSGMLLTKELNENQMIQLCSGFRLCPKKPFVIGGDFDIQNVYLLNTYKCIAFNFEIASQIINIPDGKEVKIIFK